MFRIAPFLVFAPVAISLVVIPFAAGWAPLDASVGMLFFLAVPSVSVIGILAGRLVIGQHVRDDRWRCAAPRRWSPTSCRARSRCSRSSFSPASLRPTEVMAAWQWWWIPLNLIGFVVFFIASIAEVNRGPFDLPEAESELVAGYFADYSGIRWAIFMMSEYGGVVAASLFARGLLLRRMSVAAGCLRHDRAHS